MTVKLLDTFRLIDKNSSLYQLKRRKFVDVVPSAKLHSEIASVAHGLYHPKRPQDVASLRHHLGMLLQGYNNRQLPVTDTILWARELMTNTPHVRAQRTSSLPWKPNTVRFQQFFNLAKERTTTRHVVSNTFDRSIVHDLILCAVQAPSSCNKQGWRFIIIDDPIAKNVIADIKRQAFLRKYPYIVCVCFDTNAYLGLDYEMTPYLDCGGALQNLCTAATAYGLASCWCNFALKNSGKRSHARLRSLLQLPKNLIPVSLVGLGIPEQVYEKPPRQSIDFYMPFERF